MKTKIILALALSFVVFASAPASAGLGKWLKKEAIPTLKGERPLEIKPYVSIKHDKTVEFRVGPNELKLQVGGVTIQTHQLAKRLVQAGCVYATSGDILRCAPDVIERELLNIADGIDTSNPNTIPVGAMPPYTVPSMFTPMPSFTSGTIMQQCGCWGFNPPQIAYEPRCSNTRVVVNACHGFCPAGGMPYAYTCM